MVGWGVGHGQWVSAHQGGGKGSRGEQRQWGIAEAIEKFILSVSTVVVCSTVVFYS